MTDTKLKELEKDKTKNKSLDVISESYDKEIYESKPFKMTTPEHLASIAHIFGHNAPNVKTARVLELGCAAGGNILPFAARNPEAYAIGVDLSKNQINIGQKEIIDQNLKNVDLKAMSITDIDESFGKFDYIITHGVFSWVPDFVQKKIFEICQNNLSKNGLFYVSYNTLPGWNIVNTIKDMMRFHAKNFQNNIDRAKQCRAILNFIKDAHKDSDTAYARAIKGEAALLEKQPDYYLLHEYLEDNNTAFYFSDINEAANQHDLMFLGEAHLSAMNINNLGPQASEMLSKIKNIAEAEQYIDFVKNRRFRSSIFCRKEAPLNRKLSFDSIKDMHFNFNMLIPKAPLNQINIHDESQKLEFYLDIQRKSSISGNAPALKAILYNFAYNLNYPLSVKQIIAQSKKLAPKVSNKAFEDAIKENLLNLALAGYLNLSKNPPAHVNKISNKPKASDLSRIQANKSNVTWITAQDHSATLVNMLEIEVLKLLDGTRDLEKILSDLVIIMKEKNYTLERDGILVDDIENNKGLLLSNIKRILNSFAMRAILVG